MFHQLVQLIRDLMLKKFTGSIRVDFHVGSISRKVKIEKVENLAE